MVLVIEREPYWAPECARQLVGVAEVEICRDERDWAEKPTAAAPAVILFETAALSSSVHAIARLCESQADTIAIVPAGSESMEWWLRELGLSAVYRDDHPRDEVLETCRRLLHHQGRALDPARRRGEGLR